MSRKPASNSSPRGMQSSRAAPFRIKPARQRSRNSAWEIQHHEDENRAVNSQVQTCGAATKIRAQQLRKRCDDKRAEDWPNGGAEASQRRNQCELKRQLRRDNIRRIEKKKVLRE